MQAMPQGFFSLTPKPWELRPDDNVSPGVLRKMVYAGSHASSFQQASKDLKEEAELDISEQRIVRATKRIGQERTEQRDAAGGGLGGTAVAGAATCQSAGTSSSSGVRGSGWRKTPDAGSQGDGRRTSSDEAGWFLA